MSKVQLALKIVETLREATKETAGLPLADLTRMYTHTGIYGSVTKDVFDEVFNEIRQSMPEIIVGDLGGDDGPWVWIRPRKSA